MHHYRDLDVPLERKRIAKKWRKRYGAVMKCSHVVWQMGDWMAMCACVEAEVRKSTGTKRENVK